MNKTFLAKLQDFKVKYLVFIKAGAESAPRYSIVRVDPSGVYPRDGFATDFMNRFEGSAFFGKVGDEIKKLASPPEAPRFDEDLRTRCVGHSASPTSFSASQTLSGVSGMSMLRTPACQSASMTALT